MAFVYPDFIAASWSMVDAITDTIPAERIQPAIYGRPEDIPNSLTTLDFSKQSDAFCVRSGGMNPALSHVSYADWDASLAQDALALAAMGATKLAAMNRLKACRLFCIGTPVVDAVNL